MTNHFAVNDVCCVALELSKSTWVCAFASPGDWTERVFTRCALVMRIACSAFWRLAGRGLCARCLVLWRSCFVTKWGTTDFGSHDAHGPGHPHDRI